MKVYRDSLLKMQRSWWWLASWLGGRSTPWKISMVHLQPSPMQRKENHLNQTSRIMCKMLIFQGWNPQIIHFSRVFHEKKIHFWGFSHYFWKHRHIWILQAPLFPSIFSQASRTITTNLKAAMLPWPLGTCFRNRRFHGNPGNKKTRSP